MSRHVDPAQVAIVGLHSVFERHEVMTPQALAAFIHEYRLAFPIAVDQPAPDGGIPLPCARTNSGERLRLC